MSQPTLITTGRASSTVTRGKGRRAGGSDGARRARRARTPLRAFAVLLAAVLLSIAVGGGATARAQQLEPPRARQGYYFALGYSPTFLKPWEDTENWNVWAGSDFSFRLGQMITRRLGLGLQIHFGGAKGQAQTAGLFGLGLEGQVEMARNLALFASVGLDVVQYISDDGLDETTRGTVGSGYALGIGYDWFFTKRLTGGWAVRPVAQIRYVPGTTASAFMGMLGVELAYFTGLPRNQLDLPPGEAFKRQ